jgi:hypothetical protein
VKKPLLRMLRCESVAPFGKPVVPEVYWMLIGSVLDSVAIRSATASAGRPSPCASRSSQSRVPRKTTRSRARSPELAPAVTTSSTMAR